MSRPQAVIIGAGALGLGYLAERLVHDYDLVLADISAKSDLLNAIADAQGFTLSICHREGVQRTELAGAFRIALTDTPQGRAALAGALETSDLVLTAVGARVLPRVVELIAPMLNARTRPSWLLFAENGLNIATSQAPHFSQHVTLADTVMSRMCRLADAEEPGSAPLHPASETRLIVEAYGYLPLDQTVCGGGPFSQAFDLVSHEAFLCWEDVKLFLHNGMHAFVSYHAYLAGARRFPETPPAIRQQAQQVMLHELVPALVYHHPSASQTALADYSLELLERFFNPYFNDSIERGIRNVAEKLAPGERLVGGCEFIRRAGIEPKGYSSTIQAAKQIMAEQAG